MTLICYVCIKENKIVAPRFFQEEMERFPGPIVHCMYLVLRIIEEKKVEMMSMGNTDIHELS